MKKYLLFIFLGFFVSSDYDFELLRAQYDTPPKLKRKLKLKPAKYKNLDSVTIKFYVNEKGKASEISLVKSSGEEDFDKDAFLAIKKSKWNPAVKNKNKIPAWHQLEIKF